MFKNEIYAQSQFAFFQLANCKKNYWLSSKKVIFHSRSLLRPTYADLEKIKYRFDFAAVFLFGETSERGLMTKGV